MFRLPHDINKYWFAVDSKWVTTVAHKWSHLTGRGEGDEKVTASERQWGMHNRQGNNSNKQCKCNNGKLKLEIRKLKSKALKWFRLTKIQLYLQKFQQNAWQTAVRAVWLSNTLTIFLDCRYNAISWLFAQKFLLGLFPSRLLVFPFSCCIQF